MNKIYNPEKKDWKKVLLRPTQTVADIEATVNSVFKEVAEEGDTVLKKYTEKFDGVSISDSRIKSSHSGSKE